MANGVDLQDFEDEELFGEIRRRSIETYQLRKALRIEDPPRVMVSSLRDRALWILGLLTLVLVVIVGVLALREQQIPDLLSGLTGSGIGAIAGILASGGSGESSGAARPGD